MVEVTLALGILSFSLITLITVASLGFTSSKDSTADVRTSTIANQVYQKVRTELCTSDMFANPPSTWGGNPPCRDYWFDDQGTEWSTTTLNGRVYRARAVLVPQAGVNRPVGLDEQTLKALVIQVDWPVDPATGLPSAQANTSQQKRIFSLLLRNPGYKGEFP